MESSNKNNNNNIQNILNSLMEPEAHIPRLIRTKEFTKTQFRDYTILEAVKHKKTEFLLKSLTNKEESISMLCHLFTNGILHKVSRDVHEKMFSMVMRKDLPTIIREYEKVWKNNDLFIFHLSRGTQAFARDILLKYEIVKLSDTSSLFNKGKH